MKLCVVAYKFGTEKEIGEHLGTYHYFIEKMRTLVRMGHEVTVVAPHLSFFKKGSQDVDGVKIKRYWPPMLASIWAWPINKMVRWLYIKQTQRHVSRAVKDGCEVVYVWQARETGYAVAQIKEKLGIPFIFRQITAWHWHFERKASEIFGARVWYKKLQKIGLQKIVDLKLNFLLDKKSQLKFARTIYAKADKIVFLSKAAVEEGKLLGLDASKATDLGVAIEEKIFKPLDNKNELRQKLGITGEKIILFIGRINFDEKGVGYLMKAMPEIITKVPDVRLIIIGSGPDQKKMEELIQEVGMGKYINPVGKKPFTELVQWICSADVFVVPSVWMEAFGQVTIEAMSCGVPVVTTDAGASPEINMHGETGLVVPIRDSKAIADAVVKILSDDVLRKKMGEAARKRVLENYTYEVMTKKCLEIIDRVEKSQISNTKFQTNPNN